MQILVLPSVLTQMPVQASHHMANVPGLTTSRSISSFSQVPHCGKVLRTHDSLVISSTFAMSLSYLRFRLISTEIILQYYVGESCNARSK